MDSNAIPTCTRPDKKNSRLIRITEVMAITGLSRSYIYALSAAEKFPRSMSLVPGGTSRAWLHSEVIDWVDQRVAERDLEVTNG